MSGRHAKPYSPLSAAVTRKVAALLPGVLAAGTVAGVAVSGSAGATTDHPVLPDHTTALAHPLAPVAKKAPVRVKDPLYTVRKGDSLSAIAQRLCHAAADWTGIYKKNHKTIGADPNLIIPGQVLAMACHQAVIAAAAPQHTARLAAAQTGSGQWGHPYKCGDGDGDGWDLPCSALEGDQSPAQPDAPAPAPPPPSATVTGVVTTSGLSGFEQCVIAHESGGNPAALNPASRAGGLFQFLPSTWASLGLGYPGGAQTAPVPVQMQGFQIEYARAGTSPWAPYDGC